MIPLQEFVLQAPGRDDQSGGKSSKRSHKRENEVGKLHKGTRLANGGIILGKAQLNPIMETRESTRVMKNV
jgi:hypothetical protein